MNKLRKAKCLSLVGKVLSERFVTLCRLKGEAMRGQQETFDGDDRLLVTESNNWYPTNSVRDMSKRYQIVRDLVPTREGGFVHAIRVAIVEFACMGERRFDISGYPHHSADDAFVDDWNAIAGDARRAISKVGEIAARSAGSERGEGEKEAPVT